MTIDTMMFVMVTSTIRPNSNATTTLS